MTGAKVQLADMPQPQQTALGRRPPPNISDVNISHPTEDRKLS